MSFAKRQKTTKQPNKNHPPPKKKKKKNDLSMGRRLLAEKDDLFELIMTMKSFVKIICSDSECVLIAFYPNDNLQVVLRIHVTLDASHKMDVWSTYALWYVTKLFVSRRLRKTYLRAKNKQKNKQTKQQQQQQQKNLPNSPLLALYEGSPPVIDIFPSQKSNDAESIPIRIYKDIQRIPLFQDLIINNG